jgi:hypothetical protein
MRRSARRAWLLLPGRGQTLAGLDAGLLPLDDPAPVDAAHLAQSRGPLMVLAFSAR